MARCGATGRAMADGAVFKADKAEREMLMQADPETFFLHPHYAPAQPRPRPPGPDRPRLGTARLIRDWRDLAPKRWLKAWDAAQAPDWRGGRRADNDHRSRAGLRPVDPHLIAVVARRADMDIGHPRIRQPRLGLVPRSGRWARPPRCRRRSGDPAHSPARCSRARRASRAARRRAPAHGSVTASAHRKIGPSSA